MVISQWWQHKFFPAIYQRAQGHQYHLVSWKWGWSTGYFFLSTHIFSPMPFQPTFQSTIGSHSRWNHQNCWLIPLFHWWRSSWGTEKPVMMGELEIVLKWFKKDKSPSLDGWPVEFYLTFFELLEQDLLHVVKESKTYGCMYDTFNSTFNALIPKSDMPQSFNDYRTISLCNCIYKIISKIIAIHLKPILSHHISLEQFSFLDNQ